MLHRTPVLSAEVATGLRQLDELRAELSRQLRPLARWTGTLRRMAQAEVVRHSTAIEGFQVSARDALAIVEGHPAPTTSEQDQQALLCYRDAMDWVLTVADDPEFGWSGLVIRTLHFQACRFQREADPGRWRTIPIGIGGPDGPVYEGPPATTVPGLMEELAGWLETNETEHPVIRAAMAHFHLVSIHPFRDGNGRVSRILQSLVLAREGILSPEFASIEQYLGAHTADYYQALQMAHGPRYDPTTDADPWLAFVIRAHLAEATTLWNRIQLAWARFTFCERIAEARGWPDRTIHAMDAALAGVIVRNEDYRKEHGISSVTAASDLRQLVEGGVLLLQGRGRGAHYLVSPLLQEQWQAAAASMPKLPVIGK